MDISSHYYALLALCRSCGINKDISQKIAYASQFVDDNKINCIYANNGFSIEDISTVHSYYKIKTFNYQSMIYNSVAFHFFPGAIEDSSIDFTHRLICKESPKELKYIIQKSIQSSECSAERLGMLIHIYADTYSHQGFSGLLSKQNDIKKATTKNYIPLQSGIFDAIKSYIKKKKIVFNSEKNSNIGDFIPAYGHAQVYNYPDIPYLEWSYSVAQDRCSTRSKEIYKIDNKIRYKNAFLSIKNFLEEFLEKNPDYIDNSVKVDNLKEFFEILIYRVNKKNSIKKWQKYMIKYRLYEKKDRALVYNEADWLYDVFEDFSEGTKIHYQRRVNSVNLKRDFKNSSWYRFVRSVQWYKVEFINICKKNQLYLHR
jgi:hypothetical protein